MYIDVSRGIVQDWVIGLAAPAPERFDPIKKGEPSSFWGMFGSGSAPAKKPQQHGMTRQGQCCHPPTRRLIPCGFSIQMRQIAVA